MIAMHMPPPVVIVAPQAAPEALLVKRRKRGSRSTSARRSRLPAWLVVGAVFVMSDGRTCHVVRVEGDQYWCAVEE